MARWQLANARERRAPRGIAPGDEELREGGSVELASCVRVAQERLRLRGEAEVVADPRHEERADAESVSCQNELAGQRVPDGEGKVAVEAVEAAGSPAGISVCEHLRIGSGREVVAEPLELTAQLDVVVDLAVLYHPVASR